MKFKFFNGVGIFLIFSLSLVAQTSHLSNLSVLDLSGTNSDALTAGFTIGQGPAKQILIRAIGPALSNFGITNVIPDPSLTVYDSKGNAIASNDNWDPALTSIFTQVGAFPLTAGSKDAAVVVTLPAGNYTVKVTGMGSNPIGNTIIEMYEVSATTTQLVNLSALVQVGGTGSSIVTAGITVAQGSGNRILLIRAVGPTLTNYGVQGVNPNPQLQVFSGSNVIAQNDDWQTPVGQSAAIAQTLNSAFTQSGAFNLTDGSKDAAVLVTLQPGSYTIQASGVNNASGKTLIEVYDLTTSTQLKIYPNAPLFFTQLRPSSTATSSTASGYASVTFDSSGNAVVSVNISNLSSPQTNAYLRLAGTNDYLTAIPIGQVNQKNWVITSVGNLSVNDIITALNSGQIYVSIGSANFPNGELTGTLTQTQGTQNFSAPTYAPQLATSSLTNPTAIDASRLLSQATFGPTDASIAEVQNLGISAWIDKQMSLTPTLMWPIMVQELAQFPKPPFGYDGFPIASVDSTDSLVAWWKLAATSQDQLRQRVAFALSELFVIYGSTFDCPEPDSKYYDMLITNAFGNFRDLLNLVTLNGEMAQYLTYLQNQKANPLTGTSPDENYARELQQLFTVGLVQLNPDGTLLLDSQSQPIPTYNNTTITETAKVLTGWSWKSNTNNFFEPTQTSIVYQDTDSRIQPLVMYQNYHDTNQKKIISLQQLNPLQATPTTIPAGQTGEADLKMLLDTLFNHPNTGPFICKQLIQKLVTSNPSPGYVYRVSQVFANNGKNVRGDLGAVVKAILTDYEARSPDVLNNSGYGKIKEPIIRFVAEMRAFKTAAPNGRFMDSYWGDPKILGPNFSPSGMFVWGGDLGQVPQRAPSVFNFFSPGYTQPGIIAQAGLVAPEMQITDSHYAISQPNILTSFIYKTPPTDPFAPTPSPYLVNDFSAYTPLAQNPDGLLSELDLIFCGGNMSSGTKNIIKSYLSQITVPDSVANYPGVKQTYLSADTSLQAPQVAAFDPNSNFTIELWYYPTNIGNFSWIAGKGGHFNGPPYVCYELIIDSSGKPGIQMSNSLTNNFYGLSANSPLTIGKWAHLAGTYDGSTLKFYVNGVLQSSIASSAGPIADITSNFMTNFSPAYMSQLRFWNVARTQSQIQQSMAEGVPSNKQGLVGCWLLNDGVGTTAKDSSGNNYDLTPTWNGSTVTWESPDLVNLYRTQLALHMIVASPDSAIQK